MPIYTEKLGSTFPRFWLDRRRLFPLAHLPPSSASVLAPHLTRLGPYAGEPASTMNSFWPGKTVLSLR